MANSCDQSVSPRHFAIVLTDSSRWFERTRIATEVKTSWLRFSNVVYDKIVQGVRFSEAWKLARQPSKDVDGNSNSDSQKMFANEWRSSENKPTITLRLGGPQDSANLCQTLRDRCSFESGFGMESKGRTCTSAGNTSALKLRGGRGGQASRYTSSSKALTQLNSCLCHSASFERGTRSH